MTMTPLPGQRGLPDIARMSAMIEAAGGHPARLAILFALSHGPSNVLGLSGRLGLAQQATSHHLTILRLRELVTFEKAGKSNHHRITDQGRYVLDHLPWYELAEPVAESA
jgi:DNA-binding transcriptional ArsR family regulator